MVAAAVVAGSIGGAYLSSRASKSAAETAANAQQQSAQAGISQQQQMFDAFQKALAPYANAGMPALTAQQDLLGLNGAPAQQTAINNIQSMPYYQGLVKQGESGILANASATGGLRGGNVQAALGQFQPQLLASLIQQQFSNLGGISRMGQASAAGVGDAGLQTGNDVANLLGQQGAAQAGSALAGGRAMSNMYNAFGNSLGMYAGLSGLGSSGTYNAAAARDALSASQSLGVGSSVTAPTLGPLPVDSSLFKIPSSF